jgi:phosphoglycerol transferase MdoB-like AlkP superfamily enzyme
MDTGAGGNRGTFFPLLILYSVFFYATAALSICGMLFSWVAGLRATADLFLAAALFALLFNVVTVFFYEGYMQSRTDMMTRRGVSNYTLNKYAITLSLGISAVMLLAVGMVWIAVWVAR